MPRVHCRFQVTSSEPQGKRMKLVYHEDGATSPGEPVEVFHVEAYPVITQGPDDPNASFFESTPSGQLQLWSVVGFQPKVGSVLDLLIDYEPA